MQLKLVEHRHEVELPRRGLAVRVFLAVVRWGLRACSNTLTWLGRGLGEFALKWPRLAAIMATFMLVCLILIIISSPPVMDWIRDKWPTWDAFVLWLWDVLAACWSKVFGR